MVRNGREYEGYPGSVAHVQVCVVIQRVGGTERMFAEVVVPNRLDEFVLQTPERQGGFIGVGMGCDGRVGSVEVGG